MTEYYVIVLPTTCVYPPVYHNCSKYIVWCPIMVRFQMYSLFLFRYIFIEIFRYFEISARTVCCHILENIYFLMGNILCEAKEFLKALILGPVTQNYNSIPVIDAAFWLFIVWLRPFSSGVLSFIYVAFQLTISNMFTRRSSWCRWVVKRDYICNIFTSENINEKQQKNLYLYISRLFKWKIYFAPCVNEALLDSSKAI